MKIAVKKKAEKRVMNKFVFLCAELWIEISSKAKCFMLFEIFNESCSHSKNGVHVERYLKDSNSNAVYQKVQEAKENAMDYLHRHWRFLKRIVKCVHIMIIT